jgi:alanyl-tRNA synthetase
MRSSEIRKAFLDFFKGKEHHIVPSAPIVVKNDPTLMFTNAGMNQFKDIFLGNAPAQYKRIADTQKCLRVSGKHNDLEEVGKDTYHHTMFEMLGNWSFGDYFKKEAIAWSWEFLTEVVKINKENIYVTVFGGDEKDGTQKDMEAYNLWKEIIDESHILFGNKKDNFWEMGDTGPCGPCSEIHVDIRNQEDKLKVKGQDLINQDHPLVIEIWNLVFIQYQRFANGKLELLSNKYVDTGMGFERLCMVLQGKQSNYDTDVFQPYIQKLSEMCGCQYQAAPSPLERAGGEADIAMRVIADHLRAVSFTIADGQLPSNTGAGYVIRRILRRAVRYGFTFLKFDKPFIYQLVPTLVDVMGDYFPELKKQQTLVTKVIQEEEASFLRTLSQGIQRFEQYISAHSNEKTVNGDFAFELFDTYGFPIDLTQLMAGEKGYNVDMDAFNKGLATQKERSRAVATQETDDWVIVTPSKEEILFLGYDQLATPVKILRYRKVKAKEKESFQLVFDQTPFYAEAGGQVGDSGTIQSGNEKIKITNTKKENNLHIHIAEKLPENPAVEFVAEVNTEKRQLTENNHSATHLLHYALRQVLGTHVEQKGSFVNSERLRFDFSHFSKMSKEEIHKVEKMVNNFIRQNITTNDLRCIPITEAETMGAMALFGEKYGDMVRVVQFGDSIEFCGGTHVNATGNIGLFKIVSETAIAAGIRRIEAITADAALDYVDNLEDNLEEIKSMLNNAPNIVTNLQKLIQENEQLKIEMENFRKEKSVQLEKTYSEKFQERNGFHILKILSEDDPNTLKDIAFKLRNKQSNSVLVLGTIYDEKPNLTLAFSDDMIEKGFNASNIIREAAKLMQGGGGGQPFLATAGGKDVKGLEAAVEKVIDLIING